MMKDFKYLQAKRELLLMIQNGEFSKGNKIYSERKLQEMLGYNRMTIKKAVSDLVSDGVLIRKHGSGTYLNTGTRDSRLDIGDDSPFSLTRNIQLKGMQSQSFVESFKLIYDDAQLMSLFPQYRRFYELIRYREANGSCFSLQFAYFPFDLFKDAHRYDFSKYSLYSYLEYKRKLPVTFKSKLRAFRVTDDFLAELQVRQDDYVFLIEYFGYTADGELVEYTKSYFDSDKINFSVEGELNYLDE